MLVILSEAKDFYILIENSVKTLTTMAPDGSPASDFFGVDEPRLT